MADEGEYERKKESDRHDAGHLGASNESRRERKTGRRYRVSRNEYAGEEPERPPATL